MMLSGARGVNHLRHASAHRGADAAVVPRPGVRPLLEETLSRQVPEERTRWRKRRGSVASPRHSDECVVIAEAPPRRVSGRSKRASYQTPRRRKLTPEQEDVIRALAATKSLRSLAADFGVSHETVRAVTRTATLLAASERRGVD